MNIPKKIKVCQPICPYYGGGVRNVAAKFFEYCPEGLFQWCEDFLEADIIIEHIIGNPDRSNLVNPLESDFSEQVKFRLELSRQGIKNVAYVIHCSLTDDEFFRDVFKHAIICTGFIDGVSIMNNSQDSIDKWKRVSWGVEAVDFLLPTEPRLKKEYMIYTWGCAADPSEEAILQIFEACKQTKSKMLHSGVDYRFDSGKHYRYIPPAKTPAEISQRYNSCYFANAMRNGEDCFELSNAEAVLSNSIPIALNCGSPKHFFEPYGITKFVDPDNIFENLVDIFESSYSPITIDQKRSIINGFNWRHSVYPFWSQIVNSMVRYGVYV
jgi:hypothetical protein